MRIDVDVRPIHVLVLGAAVVLAGLAASMPRAETVYFVKSSTVIHPDGNIETIERAGNFVHLDTSAFSFVEADGPKTSSRPLHL